jgi:hypothetical protein
MCGLFSISSRYDLERYGAYRIEKLRSPFFHFMTWFVAEELGRFIGPTSLADPYMRLYFVNLKSFSAFWTNY